MKLATVKALAKLTKEPVPEAVKKAYGDNNIAFGKEYLIPKPLDTRLISTICPAVAKAAAESGVAEAPISDWVAYEYELNERIGIDQRIISRLFQRAKRDPKRVVFAEAENEKVLEAAHLCKEEGLCQPILIGNKERIQVVMKEYNLDLEGCEIIDPVEERDKRVEFGLKFYGTRQRNGVTQEESRKIMRNRNYFGAMMVEVGEADALVSGMTKDYPSTIRPALEVIGMEDGVSRVAGMYLMLTKKGPLFFADTTVNVDPSVEQLVDITTLTARAVRFFDYEPNIAMLSYSNFGSAKGTEPTKVARATQILKENYPNLQVEGEMQANVALNSSLRKELYPFNSMDEQQVNTLIFPNLASGNIAYKLLMEMGSAEAIGPILMGMKKPVHVLQIGSSVRDIMNMVAIAVVDAQNQAGK
jgi:malate dehydrogenase (oxaloacetate-decarboxylating)(NADP+)